MGETHEANRIRIESRAEVERIFTYLSLGCLHAPWARE